MAYVGYTKTEKNVAAKSNGWLWLEAYVNSEAQKTHRHSFCGSQDIRRSYSPTNIYCHQDAAPEPVTDGHIKTTTFDDSETEYSGAGYIKSFTSSSGFFTKDQDLSLSGENWICHFNARNTGLSLGYVGVFRVEIYKRNTSNNDTLLASAEYQGISVFYSVIGYTLEIAMTGTVTTSDRLRIRVYMTQTPPV